MNGIDHSAWDRRGSLLFIPWHVLAISAVECELGIEVCLAEAPPITQPPNIWRDEATDLREVVAEVLQKGGAGVEGVALLDATEAVSLVWIVVVNDRL
eukprot:6121983-Prymnesium_polylepis.1